MRKLNIIASLALIVGSILMFGCGGGGGTSSTPDPNAGFRVQTFAVTQSGLEILSRSLVQANIQNSTGTTTGNQIRFDNVVTSDNNALLAALQGAKVPGNWRFIITRTLSIPSPIEIDFCSGVTTQEKFATLGTVVKLTCPSSVGSFTSLPDSIDITSPPATISFSGNGASSLTGMTRVNFYNEFGQIAGTADSNQYSYNSDGAVTGLTVTTPNGVAYGSDGVYVATINTIKLDGSLEVIGAAPLSYSVIRRLRHPAETAIHSNIRATKTCRNCRLNLASNNF